MSSSKGLAAMIRARSAGTQPGFIGAPASGAAPSPPPQDRAVSPLAVRAPASPAPAALSPVSPAPSAPPVPAADPAPPAPRAPPAPPAPPAPVVPVPRIPSPTPAARVPSPTPRSTTPTGETKYVPKVASFSGAPKCFVCAKTVYKMEEIVAIGEHWHDKCFTCGGTGSEGCGKVLKRDGYLDHSGQPFCTACYNKLYRPKGFGYGNSLNTDYGPAPSDARSVSPAKPAAAAPPLKATAPAPLPSPKTPAAASSPSKASAVAPAQVGPPSFAKPSPPAASRAAAPRAPSPPPAPKYMAPPPPKHAPAIVSIETMRAREAQAAVVSPTPTSPIAAVPAQAPAAPVPASAVAAPADPAPVPAAAPANYTPTNNTSVQSKEAPKCTICAKTVYKMEEVIAVGRVWHDKCFTCGGSAGNGCGKVLKRSGYVDHSNQPYCTPCHNRLYGPKGFGYGNTLTSTGLTADMAGLTVADSSATLPAPVAAAPVTVPKRSGSIIGTSSRAPKDTALFKEVGYVGNNDEVDDSEW